MVTPPLTHPHIPEVDAITLEVLRNALESAADEMGVVLQRTSFSPNIKERMDASCAVFDAQARLVAQAEHVPVHLGSMLCAVQAILASLGPSADERCGLEIAPGDVIIVNDPFVNGSHLSDITLVAPVYRGAELLAYVAARAHHADVGGMEPGSAPGNSREVYQEGLIIPAVRLFRGGELQEDLLRLLLANTRTPFERRGDLNAQIACLRVGQQRVSELAERYGSELLTRGFAAILDYAERRMRRRLAELPPGTYAAEDALDDDGASDQPVPLRVTVTVADGRMIIDFAGTAPQVAGNVNAVAPMTHSACFFAVKLLTDPTLPVNAGTFRPLEIRIPEGAFLDAQRPAAVCAGNTETTQRIADTVLRAFAELAPDRIPAAAQGTMNLLGIGGRDPRSGRAYTYIETIGGGMGGSRFGPGTDGVQCHLTNTMNTPVESLEAAYPLRVERYELREGSGGAGEHRGGNGIVRAIRILAPEARVSLQTERRRLSPYGLHGGEDGTPGENYLLDANGNRRPLPGKGTWTLHAGETIVVETPGGGGWNRPCAVSTD